jgi:hypothetical protein
MPVHHTQTVSRSRPPIVPVLLAAIALPLAAQVPPAFLVGTATTSLGLPGTTQVVQLNPCAPPVTMCSALPGPTGFEGGAAYDPFDRVLWVTDGSMLASVLNDFAVCDMECLTPSPVANASGLAFDASSQTLWILGIGGELARAPLGGGSFCPPVQSRCTVPIPPGMVAAGLAVSEKRGLLFVSASSAGGAPVNLVFALPIANPCQPLCTFDLGATFGTPQGSPVTGLGYDDCDDELFAVAGNNGMTRVRLSFPGCTIAAQSSCSLGSDSNFSGLCVQPQPVGTIGRSCESAPCPRCGTVRLGANDPSIGNRGFAMWVLYGQNGGFAFPAASIGPCGTGTPFLCGNVHLQLSPPPISFPMIPLTGPSTCTASAVMPMPIPADAGLCGFRFCVQAGILCPAGGTSLTNAISVHVTGA